MTGFIALLVSVELLVVSAWYWDRHKFGKENACIWDPGCLTEIDTHIPKKSVIYWEDSLHIPWLKLNRPNYASFTQAAGIIFDRQTAIEAERRLSRLAKLGVHDGTLDWYSRPKLKLFQSTAINFEGLVHVAQDQEVDFIILYKNFPEAEPKTFSNSIFEKQIYLYNCKFIRNMFIDVLKKL